MKFTDKMYVPSTGDKYLRVSQEEYDMLALSIKFCGGIADPTPLLTKLCHCPDCRGSIFVRVEEDPTTAPRLTPVNRLKVYHRTDLKVMNYPEMTRDEFFSQVSYLQKFDLAPTPHNTVVQLGGEVYADVRSLLMNARRQVIMTDKEFIGPWYIQQYVVVNKAGIHFVNEQVVRRYKRSRMAYEVMSFADYVKLCNSESLHEGLKKTFSSGGVTFQQVPKDGHIFLHELNIDLTKKTDYAKKLVEWMLEGKGDTPVGLLRFGRDWGKQRTADDVLAAINDRKVVMPFILNLDTHEYRLAEAVRFVDNKSYDTDAEALKALVEVKLREKYKRETMRLVGETTFTTEGGLTKVEGYCYYNPIEERYLQVKHSVNDFADSMRTMTEAIRKMTEANAERRRIENGELTEGEVTAALLEGKVVRCLSDSNYAKEYDTPWKLDLQTGVVCDQDGAEDEMTLREWLDYYVDDEDERFKIEEAE